MAFNVNANHRGRDSNDRGYKPSKSKFDGLDGRVFHSVFYRFKDETGIDKARDFCLYFNEAIKEKELIAVSVHCGIQNSMEDLSFGLGMKLDKSLEYGLVLTFRTLEDKLDVIRHSDLYNAFRSELNAFRDTEYRHNGILVMDWIHGEREKTNGRPPSSPNGPTIIPSGSLYHFVAFKYNNNNDEIIPFLVDMQRDTKLNSVDPRDGERALITSFIWGQSNNEESTGSFTPRNELFFDFVFVPTFKNQIDRDIYVGTIDGELPEQIKNIGYDFAHNAFKEIIAMYLDDLFVFDFIDEAVSN